MIARLLLFTMVVVGTQRDTEPGKKNHAPDNAEQPLRLKDLPLVYDWYHLNKLTATTFVIPMLFPAPGTVMISGQRSSLKSAIFMTLGLLREIFKSLNLPVRIVGLDNATSLIREKLTDEVTRKLTASMTLISTELECCVALANHTWKNDSNRAQGPIRCRITSTATTLWRVTGTMR